MGKGELETHRALGIALKCKKRHEETGYDIYLNQGISRDEAREMIANEI